MSDGPVCNSSNSAKEQIGTATVAEHSHGKARHDETHQHWIEGHRTNGTLADIRGAPREHT